MQLAVALYNNDVDDEDELEFRKGDVLTVLIENPNGLNGWWLCEHKRKCGLCPANRLRPLSNVDVSTSKSTDPTRSSSRLSTASMYDGLSSDYDIPITASSSSSSSSSSNHDYDIPHGSDFISTSKTAAPIDSSPESSSRSSGIYSSVDLRLSDLSSSSLSEFHTSTMNSHSPNNHSRSLSSMELEQLQDSFRKLAIRSSILEKYRPLIANAHHEPTSRAFVHECRLFLHEYGCLLDRHTYKIFKQSLLLELEHAKSQSSQRIVQLATQILLLIKPMIELRLKQKYESCSSIPIDVFKKLNLEPIEELTNENENNKKLTGSVSTTQIYGNFQNHSSTNQSRPSHMTTSRTCHSSFLLDAPKSSSRSYTDKSDDYDYIDDDYSSTPSIAINDPLIKCYHRHIREHIASMFGRYSHLCQLDSNGTKVQSTASLLIEGKALVVAGHKLIFVLETLHEHLRPSTKLAQLQTPLVQLTRELCDALTTFVRLLKQLSHDSCTKNSNVIDRFQQDTQAIMNVVKRIKRQCASI